MLCLSSPGEERLESTDHFELRTTGAESNVAAEAAREMGSTFGRGTVVVTRGEVGPSEIWQLYLPDLVDRQSRMEWESIAIGDLSLLRERNAHAAYRVIV